MEVVIVIITVGSIQQVYDLCNLSDELLVQNLAFQSQDSIFQVRFQKKQFIYGKIRDNICMHQLRKSSLGFLCGRRRMYTAGDTAGAHGFFIIPIYFLWHLDRKMFLSAVNFRFYASILTGKERKCSVRRKRFFRRFLFQGLIIKPFVGVVISQPADNVVPFRIHVCRKQRSILIKRLITILSSNVVQNSETMLMINRVLPLPPHKLLLFLSFSAQT